MSSPESLCFPLGQRWWIHTGASLGDKPCSLPHHILQTFLAKFPIQSERNVLVQGAKWCLKFFQVLQVVVWDCDTHCRCNVHQAKKNEMEVIVCSFHSSRVSAYCHNCSSGIPQTTDSKIAMIAARHRQLIM